MIGRAIVETAGQDGTRTPNEMGEEPVAQNNSREHVRMDGG